jgi:hypothetical protein
MKRQSILGALAALAVAFVPLLTPTSASATVVSVPCPKLNPTGTQYPDREFSLVCSGTTTDAAKMRDAVPNQAFNELARARLIYYYFATAQDYIDSVGVLGLGTAEPVIVNGNKVFAVTHFDADHKPVYTAAFGSNGGTPSPDIKLRTQLEVGRAMDSLLGYVMQGGVVLKAYTPVSASSGPNLYKSQMTTDWGIVNGKVSCGTSGLFSGRKDSTGVYICDGGIGTGSGLNASAGYTALTGCSSTPTVSPCNQNVLKKAWPLVFTPNGTGDYDKIFAEQYGPGSVDEVAPYIAQFRCSNSIQQALVNGPRIAIASDFPAGVACTVPAQQTYCYKRWNGAPQTVGRYFPDGNVFDCMPQPASLASDVVSALYNLGKNGGFPSTTKPVKVKLDSVRASVYVFSSQATMDAAFGNLGLYDGSLTNINGFSFPQNGVWYTVLNASSSANTSAKQVFIATHELGHVLDNTIAGQPGQPVQPSSFNTTTGKGTGFDLPMQNDWITVNYTAYPGSLRQPCWVQGQIPQGGTTAATYTGPLVGVIDPLNNNQQVCTNGVLTAPVTGGPSWAGKKNSFILQTIHAYQRVGELELYLQTSDKFIGKPGLGMTVKQGWREFFAQAFATQAVADLLSTPNIQAFDKAIANGYFACTGGKVNSWLKQVYLDPTVDPVTVLPLSCFTALPANYTTSANYVQ